MAEKDSLGRGLYYFEEKEFKEAELWFRRALCSERYDTAETWFRLAFSLEMQGEQLEAKSWYERVAASGCSTSLIGDALYRNGWMAMQSKEHPSAIAYFSQALEVFQKGDAPEQSSECLYWLALSYEAIGQVLKALDFYQQIREHDYWFFDVCYRRIVCLDKVGRYQEALDGCLEFEVRHAEQRENPAATKVEMAVRHISQQLRLLLTTGEDVY